jgi:hypothetical protein
MELLPTRETQNAKEKEEGKTKEGRAERNRNGTSAKAHPRSISKSFSP